MNSFFKTRKSHKMRADVQYTMACKKARDEGVICEEKGVCDEGWCAGLRGVRGAARVWGYEDVRVRWGKWLKEGQRR